MPRRGALAGSQLDQFAQLYEQCSFVSMSLTPLVVDDMELWQVAVALGKALPDTDGHDAAPQPSVHEEAAMKRYDAILRRRQGLPDLDEDDDRPAQLDPALATLITTNAPERLR